MGEKAPALPGYTFESVKDKLSKFRPLLPSLMEYDDEPARPFNGNDRRSASARKKPR